MSSRYKTVALLFILAAGFLSCGKDDSTIEVENLFYSLFSAVNGDDTVSAKKMLVTKAEIQANSYRIWTEEKDIKQFLMHNQDFARLKSLKLTQIKRKASHLEEGKTRQFYAGTILLTVPKGKEFGYVNGKIKILSGDELYAGEISALNFNGQWKILQFNNFKLLGSQDWVAESLKVSSALNVWFYSGLLLSFILGLMGMSASKNFTGYTSDGKFVQGYVDDGSIEGTGGLKGGISLALSWASIYIIHVFVSQIIDEIPFPRGINWTWLIGGMIAYLVLYFIFLWLISFKHIAAKIILAIWILALLILCNL
ncbi:MAG: hypothetical protein WCF67_15925 [Chitinophagaceae bacterium]